MTTEIVAAPRPNPLPTSLLLRTRFQDLTASYDVRYLFGQDYVVCNSVNSASYAHRGNGWTRITVASREELALVACLSAGRFEYSKVVRV